MVLKSYNYNDKIKSNHFKNVCHSTFFRIKKKAENIINMSKFDIKERYTFFFFLIMNLSDEYTQRYINLGWLSGLMSN